ncbi:MAG: DnaA/Hda family protein [Alphaproteobacteria bacterium]
MNSRKSQLALDLRIREATGRSDFLVSGCNEDSVRWIDAWPDWPGSAMVLTGPAGCGKTHLGMVWKRAAAAVEFGDGIELSDLPDAANILVDDVDRMVDDAELFHLYNVVRATGGTVLFTARVPPARWEGRLRDLVSRLSAVANVAVQPPDDVLMGAVVLKMLADQHLEVEPEILRYIVERTERSFEAARALVSDLNRVSLAERRAVTIPLVRQVLNIDKDEA